MLNEFINLIVLEDLFALLSIVLIHGTLNAKFVYNLVYAVPYYGNPSFPQLSFPKEMYVTGRQKIVNLNK